MSRTPKPCIDCGRVTTAGSRCPKHQAEWEAQRGTRTERGLGNDWQRITRDAIAAEPWCHVCGATTDLTGDHIIPRSKGGQNTPDNCRVLCRRCNSARGNR